MQFPSKGGIYWTGENWNPVFNNSICSIVVSVVNIFIPVCFHVNQSYSQGVRNRREI